MRQISFESVYCATSSVKNRNFGQMLTLGGSYTFTDEGQIWYATVDRCLRFCAKFCIYRFILSYSRGEAPPPKKNCRSLDFGVCGVTNRRHTEKVEHECTTTNIPLSNGVKTVFMFQRLHDEIVCTNSLVQKRDVQTTNKKLYVFGRPDGG